MHIEIDIHKQLGSSRKTFHLRSTLAATGQALALFGPSGSGKTLTLQAIAGLLTPDSGRIVVQGRVLFDSDAGINLPPRKRSIGYLFQNYALFPHKTVRENIKFGLTSLFGRISRTDSRQVETLMDGFRLTALAEHLPQSLSGGQQQRVALARALAPCPSLLLLDEPFSALDQPLRIKMRKELSSILKSLNIPAILVTHDADEVQDIADNVAIYDQGRVTAMHAPADLLERGVSLTQTLHTAVARAYDDSVQETIDTGHTK